MAAARYDIVIIGNSISGVTAALELRRLVPERRVTILTAEASADFYSKPLLTYYLSGKISREQLIIKTATQLMAAGIQIITGFKVIAIDVEKSYLQDELGREIHYRHLLLASGAEPVQVNLPGSDLPGVTGLRTQHDLKVIRDRIASGQNCLIIGGGLVGLKTAWALKELGKAVTVLISSSRPLSQVLDEGAGNLLAAHLQNHGIKLVLKDNPNAFSGTIESGVTGVKTEQGRFLAADLVVVGKGVKPNSILPEHQQGIPVNPYQETRYRNIFAAGDVTLSRDPLSGNWRQLALWPVAARQGLIAARNLAGFRQSWEDYFPCNSAHFGSLRLITGGYTSLDGVEAEMLSPGPEQYLRLNFIDQRLVGFILLGKGAELAGPLTWGLNRWKKAQALNWISRKTQFYVEIHC